MNVATARFATRRGGIINEFATRRERTDTAVFTRNRNMAMRERAKLGPISHTVVVAILVLIVGLIYVNAGTRATSYDYKLNQLNGDVAALEMEKEGLMFENARLAAAAANEDRNEVARAMVDVKSAGNVVE